MSRQRFTVGGSGPTSGENDMTAAHQPRRVVVAVEPGLAASIHGILGQGPFRTWHFQVAESVELVRFSVQHQPCDVVLADETILPRNDLESAPWLGPHSQGPALLWVRRDCPNSAQGADQWLHIELALKHPFLLASALHQAARLSDLRRHAWHTGRALQHCRRQVDQLVGMLWRALPENTATGWLSQRQLLERLREEINRARRHGEPFTVLLGEIETMGSVLTEPLADWLARRVVRI